MEDLVVPGPTTCPEAVLQVQSKHKTLSQMNNDLLVLTGAGTGGLATALMNLLCPGDNYLILNKRNYKCEEINGKKKR